MSYTLAVGENAPNFEKLLATDRKFYSISDINQTSLKVIKSHPKSH